MIDSSAHPGAVIATLELTIRYRRASAWFFVSLVLMWDVLMELVCRRFSLAFYILVAFFGAWFGAKFVDWLSSGGWGRKLLRGCVLLVCILGVLSALALTFIGPNWNMRCAHNYCGRAMGFSLFESPFPAGSPSCRDLHMCGNEYHSATTPSVRSAFDEMLAERGCEPL